MSTLLNATAREARVAEAEVLRDGRKRLTRYLELANRLVLPAEIGLTPGEEDIFADPPAGWEGLLLTDHHITDELAPKGKETRPILVLVFEQISPTGETQVGGRTETELPDGRKGYELNYLQYSVNPFVPGTVGSDTDPNDSSAFLQAVEGPDDGALRSIKRTYVYGGILATDIQTKNNGALIVQTITSAVTVPSTPSGYTLIGQPTQNPNGLPIYTYTYAKGTGEVSRQIEYRQSPDQGTNGVTITTIRYLTVPSVSSDPTTGPASSVNIGVTDESADGHKVWTSIYANGAGIILSSTQTKNGGKLVVYKTTSLNSVPSTPSATIGGTVALVEALRHLGSRFESGVVIYEYTWAEGEGLISQDDEWLQSPDQGTNGVSRRTIRFLVAIGNTVQPTSQGGFTAVRQSHEDSEGYTIWTTVWGKGAGLVLDESSQSESGCLIIYHRIGLGSAPSTPSATIGGTVTLYEHGTRNSDGYQIFDYRWAEGNGQPTTEDAMESDGATIYMVAQRAASKMTPSYPGSGTGYLMRLRQEAKEGHFLNTAVYKKPPPSITLTNRIKFPKPGRIDITSPNPGFILVPGSEMDILADETVDYATSQVTTPAPFSVTEYASINQSYIPLGGSPVFDVKGGNGYLSGGVTDSGGAATYNGISVTAYQYTIQASTPSAPPSGPTTIDIKNEIYLVDLSGTVVYRRIVTTFTF